MTLDEARAPKQTPNVILMSAGPLLLTRSAEAAVSGIRGEEAENRAMQMYSV